MTHEPKLYTTLASWFPLLSAPSEYAEEASVYARELRAACSRPLTTVTATCGADTFAPSSDHGGHDGPDRGLRYVEWIWDPDPSDSTYQVDYAILLRDRDGTVRVEHDRHIEGLFPRAAWLRLMGDAGFQAQIVPFEHSEVEPGRHHLVIGRRP